MISFKDITLRTALYAGGVVLLVFFLAVANPFQLYFLNDDFIHVPLAASGNFLHGHLLRPVADLTLWVDSRLWGKNAYGFHITNTVIHLANVWLAFSMYSGILKGQGRRHAVMVAYIAAALFLVYAFHSESVFWIIGRGGSLAALFMLLSVNCYLRSKGIFSLLFSLASFAVGLFTYEFVWVMPLIILILQLADRHFKRPVRWYWTISFFIVFILYFLIRLKTEGVYFGNYESASLLQLRLPHLAYNYFATLTRSFLPPMASTSVFIVLTVAVWGGLATWYVWALKKQTASLTFLAVPFLCFLVSALPSVSLGIDTHDSEGERFLYVPSIFFCLFATELVLVCIKSMRMRIAVFVLVFSMHCGFLFKSASAYQYAGQVVRHSLQCLGRAGKADTLAVYGLPAQYGGALIFRTGFEQAVQWLVPDRFRHVEVHSIAEVAEKYAPGCRLSGAGDGGGMTIHWQRDGIMTIRKGGMANRSEEQ